MRDILHRFAPKRGLSPAAAVADNTAQVTQIFDTQGMDAAMLYILTGNLADADATFAILFEDGDDAALADHAEVGAANLVGTEALAGFDFSKDDKVFQIGYIGPKRYVRATITPANNTGNAFLAAMWLGWANIRPTANPPA